MFLTLFVASSFAAPLNLWGGATAPGVVGLTPVLVASESTMSASILAATGLGGHGDFTGGVTMVSEFAGATSFGGVDTMARYFPVDGVALALHTTFNPDGTTVAGPEVHVTRTWGRFGVTANAGWRATLGGEGSALSGGIAPEVWVLPRISTFVELDPSVSFGPDGGVALVAVPGVSAALDEDSVHSLAVGVQLPVYPDVSGVSAGFWYTAVLGG